MGQLYYFHVLKPFKFKAKFNHNEAGYIKQDLL